MFGRKRFVCRAPAIEGVGLEPGLPHGFCGGDFPGTPSGNHPLEIVWQGSWLAAGVLALLFGNRDALALALQDIFAFKFCGRREYGQHEFAGRRGRIDGLFAADELYMLFGQPVHETEQVARVSCEPAD